MKSLTVDRLRDVLYYDQDTGHFTWHVHMRANKVADNRAGSISRQGYRVISIDGKRYRAHRLAWFYMTGEWPKSDIDHINGIRDDNRWLNLRHATRSQNNANAKRRIDNEIGFKGVCLHSCGKYMAQIQKNKEHRYLGLFSTPHEAYLKYLETAQETYGEFAHG